MVSPRPRSFLSLVLLLLLAALFPPAHASEVTDRAMVLEAQRVLGGEIPSWPVEIRNERRASVYGKITHALVFAWRGGLWFYCPADGTQSLSRYRNQVEQDRANLLPLLQQIEAGFAGFRERPAELDTSVEPTAGPRATVAAAPKPGALRNGCFIESLAFARSLSSALPRALRADIVSYYIDQQGKRYGHSVVWFTTAEGDFVYDSNLEPRVQAVRLRGERTPLEFARSVADRSTRHAVAKSIALAVEVAGADDTALAADSPRGAPDSEPDPVIR